MKLENDQILIAPILSEKATQMNEEGRTRHHRYLFRVHVKANKHQIKAAIKGCFSVNPIRCNVIRMKRKKMANVPVASAKSFRRGHGHRAEWKKAIVTLAEGEKLGLYEKA